MVSLRPSRLIVVKVSVRVSDCEGGPGSLTVTVNVALVSKATVPWMVAVAASNVSPAGRPPEVMFQVNGPVPPVRPNWMFIAAPVFTVGRAVVEILTTAKTLPARPAAQRAPSPVSRYISGQSLIGGSTDRAHFCLARTLQR